MNFSAHSRAYCLSFGTMVWYFASSVELQAYDSKREGDRSLFVFRFQATGSDFLLGIEINDDSHCHLMFQTGIFQRSRGCVSVEPLWGQAPRPPCVSLFSPTIVNAVAQCNSGFAYLHFQWCYDLLANRWTHLSHGLHLAYVQPGINQLRSFIAGKDEILSYVYRCCNGILLHLLSKVGCNFRRAISSVAG